ncbi:protein mono-ADP-ribosyltransferase Parp16-like [Drosophila bipectinata]|uniref:protein mono-ADP-ribosyltransferase Parp16-like n=1 Tax=Drosophila bipectinata TaxID=42026 RepID=UPI001C8AEFF0|nr:protein mono-ADP-ribosyltransferase Parp16-like [Drosophila bipectinata]XP_017090631.2 protein mono-ADP-ribosyltransferase Parp16-like [Drosophila bipectinata]
MHSNAPYHRLFDTIAYDLPPWVDTTFSHRAPMWAGQAFISGSGNGVGIGGPGSTTSSSSSTRSNISGASSSSGYISETVSESIFSSYFRLNDLEGRHNLWSTWCSGGDNQNEHARQDRDSISPSTPETAIALPFSAWQIRAMERLRELLEHNLIGVDAKWMLFVASVMSYRSRSLFRACAPPTVRPPLVGRKLDGLTLAVSNLPDMLQLRRQLKAKHMPWGPLPDERVALLHWVLIESRTPYLRPLRSHERSHVWAKVGQRPLDAPNLVFQVVGGGPDSQVEGDPANEAVCAAYGITPSTWLFYSGEMDALYPMICAPEDPGQEELQLQQDLNVACDRAPACACWGQSLCGSVLRCVAVCQIRQARLQVCYLLIYTVAMSQRPNLRELMGEWQQEGILQTERSNQVADNTGRNMDSPAKGLFSSIDWGSLLKNVGVALNILCSGRSW